MHNKPVNDPSEHHIAIASMVVRNEELLAYMVHSAAQREELVANSIAIRDRAQAIASHFASQR